MFCPSDLTINLALMNFSLCSYPLHRILRSELRETIEKELWIWEHRLGHSVDILFPSSFGMITWVPLQQPDTTTSWTVTSLPRATAYTERWSLGMRNMWPNYFNLCRFIASCKEWTRWRSNPSLTLALLMKSSYRVLTTPRRWCSNTKSFRILSVYSNEVFGLYERAEPCTTDLWSISSRRHMNWQSQWNIAYTQ